MNQLTNEEALQNLVVAARLAKLSAEEHELLVKCDEQLSKALRPHAPELKVVD